MKVKLVGLFSEHDKWIIIHDGFWRFIAVAFLWVAVLWRIANGYQEGQRIEIEQARIVLDYMKSNLPLPEPEGLPKPEKL